MKKSFESTEKQILSMVIIIMPERVKMRDGWFKSNHSNLHPPGTLTFILFSMAMYIAIILPI